MKISVVMIDGQFREHTYGAEYFSRQDFPEGEFEVIWVEFYSTVPDAVRAQTTVKVITLDNPDDKTYHASYCFNAGIAAATGELIVIPDADQIVKPDFLGKLYAIHSAYDRLVVYAYRYDEVEQGHLNSLDFEELEEKCVLKNPLNYGGCMSVRKKWLIEINGYEQHKMMETGFHANGLDLYTRFKNYGLAIMWATDTKLFHPWQTNITSKKISSTGNSRTGNTSQLMESTHRNIRTRSMKRHSGISFRKSGRKTMLHFPLPNRV